MSKNTGLGKGLGAIFSGDVTRVLDDIQNGQQDERVQEQTRIPVSEIRPNPYQPRKVFDQPALEELSQSIRQHGVFTPVLVKKSVQGYDLIAGERRLRATRMAGLQEIPAIIVEMSDQEMMEVALLENIQREDLNVIEEAKAYQQMIRSLNSFENIAVSMTEGYFRRFDYYHFPEVFASVSKADVEAFLRENVTEERAALSIIDPAQ